MQVTFCVRSGDPLWRVCARAAPQDPKFIAKIKEYQNDPNGMDKLMQELKSMVPD